MPQAATHGPPHSGLAGIYLPRVQVHTNRLPFRFIHVTYRPFRIPLWQQSKISPASKGRSTSVEIQRRHRELQNVSCSRRHFVGESVRCMHTVIWVTHRKYTRIIDKSELG